MRSRSEREIARRLAERGEVEPPAGLLERIQAEIPAEIPGEIQVAPEIRPAWEGRFRARQAWLIAASLVATLGAGLFSLHLLEDKQGRVPPPADLAKSRAAAEADEKARAPERALPAPGTTGPKPVPMAGPTPTPALAPLRASATEDRAEPQEKPASPAKRPAVGSLASVQQPAPAPALPSTLQPDRRPAAEAAPAAGIVGGVAGGSPAGASEPERRESQDPNKIEESIEVTSESPLIEVPKAPAAPAARSQAMNRAERMRADRTAAGFVDAAASPRDLLGSRPRTGSQDRAKAAAERPEKLIDAMAGTAISSTSPAAEGAPSPFGTDDRRRWLLFRSPAPASPAGISGIVVEFNPAVVARYRRVSAGAVLLYEVELRTGGEADAEAALVATLQGGARPARLQVADLDPSWQLASPGFRLASLAAKLVELEASPGSPSPRAAREELLRWVRSLAAELPGDRRVGELRQRVEQLSP